MCIVSSTETCEVSRTDTLSPVTDGEGEVHRSEGVGPQAHGKQEAEPGLELRALDLKASRIRWHLRGVNELTL